MNHILKTEIGSDIVKAKELLQNNKIVAIPTETVYGLAANAFSTEAVIKIFEAKNRPFFDPLIVHSYAIDAVLNFVEEIDSRLLKLAHKFWPGPITLLLPKKNVIPDVTTSGLPHVGVRIPNHKLTLNLLKSLDFPLAAPSANPFGYVSPTSSNHVYKQLKGKLNYILDGGECTVGLESTIVGIENSAVYVYRLGGISTEAIEQEIGNINLKISSGDNPNAPGMLSAHYATSKNIIIGNIDSELVNYPNSKIGIISYFKNYSHIANANNIILSPKKDLNEAAKNLFSAMRLLDEQKLDLIITEHFPNEGLGRAINDRLKRASFKIKN